jgi:hypothetical protein
MDGTSVGMTAGVGYPNATGILVAAGINGTDYTVTTTGTVVDLTVDATHTTCKVSYEAATGVVTDSATTGNCD